MSAIAGAARPAPRDVTQDIVAGLRVPLGQVRSQLYAVARSRRGRFYLDVAGATFVMALFVLAAVLI